MDKSTVQQLTECPVHGAPHISGYVRLLLSVYVPILSSRCIGSLFTQILVAITKRLPFLATSKSTRGRIGVQNYIKRGEAVI